LQLTEAAQNMFIFPNTATPLQAISHSNRFCTTQWTLVLNAQDVHAPENARALEGLCRTYWYPLYFFARRKGFSEHDAQDLVQGFFGKLLEKDYLSTVDRSHGKFRTFLLTALNSYLCNELDRKNALKRGGGTTVVSIDAELAEGRYSQEPAASGGGPEEGFEKAWAETVVEKVMNRLRSEAGDSGQTDRFEALTCCLLGQSDASYAELGKQLNLSEGGVKSAVRRLRQRFGELLRLELSVTVTSPEEVEQEIRHFMAVLRR
jgi:RNA polymerase sigma-70 factor (ECF subfamily)